MKMPVRKQNFELDGDYEGWKFTARINMPMGVLERMGTGKISEINLALSDIALEWNFVDEEGEYLGNPCLDTVRLLPSDLAISMANLITNAVQKVPNK